MTDRIYVVLVQFEMISPKYKLMLYQKEQNIIVVTKSSKFQC
jgi:hypothetical protein